MLTTIALASALLSVSASEPVCPVMPSHALPAKPIFMEWNGGSFGLCCGGCEAPFTKEPMKFIKTATEKNQIVGTFLFDPISKKRLEAKNAKASFDFGGVRYNFENEANMTAFKAMAADKMVKWPEKQSMTCPVSGEAIPSQSKAAGYMDFEGVRYYACCEGCMPTMLENPAKVVAKIKDTVKPVSVTKAPTAE